MKYFIFVAIFLISQINGLSLRSLFGQDKARNKRFLLDTLHAIGGIALHFSPECVFCKCYEMCHAEQFGYHGNEIDYCGEVFWDSINCSANSYYSTTTKLSITATSQSKPPTIDPSVNQSTEHIGSEMTDTRGAKEDKRFILSTFYNVFVGAPAALMSTLVSSAGMAECDVCKCYNVCSADRFFGGMVTEKEICGSVLWDAINCAGVTKPPETTTVAPQILPNGTSVTQSPPSTVKSCDRMCVIGSVAKAVQMSSNITSMCISGNHTSNSALPVVCCGMKPQSMWKKGAKVVDLCLTDDINYSPVAAFVNGEYVPGSAGILVACKSNGFQVATQTCDKAPIIGAVTTHKHVYYVIEQH